MATTFPFVRFMQLPGRAGQHGVLGFSLSFFQDLLKPQQASSSGKSTSVDEALNYQVRLINAFWSGGVTAWDLRFIKTSQRSDIEVCLLCRLCSPEYLPMEELHHYCLGSAMRTQQLFASFGYELQPLIHESSLQARDMLSGIGPKGQSIYQAYTTFAQSLRQPYLLRIALAASSLQSLEQVGRALLDEINSTQAAGTGAILQYPQNYQEQQCLYHSLQHLAWVPWGNLRSDTPDTARLRYLVDDRSASIAFRPLCVTHNFDGRT